MLLADIVLNKRGSRLLIIACHHFFVGSVLPGLYSLGQDHVFWYLSRNCTTVDNPGTGCNIVRLFVNRRWRQSRGRRDPRPAPRGVRGGTDRGRRAELSYGQRRASSLGPASLPQARPELPDVPAHCRAPARQTCEKIRKLLPRTLRTIFRIFFGKVHMCP